MTWKDIAEIVATLISTTGATILAWLHTKKCINKKPSKRKIKKMSKLANQLEKFTNEMKEQNENGIWRQ